MQAHFGPVILRDRNVNEWMGLLAQRRILTVPGDTHNLKLRAGAVPKLEALSDGTLVLPHAATHTLVNDRDVGPFRSVLNTEFAAIDESDAHGREIAGSDRIPLRPWTFVFVNINVH